MGKKRKWLIKICFTAFALCMIALAYHNYKVNSEFFIMPLSTCISICVAVGISYILTQRQTDTRKRKDILLNLLNSLQNMIGGCDSYIICDDTTKASVNMKKREISNKIEILKEYKDEFDFDTEIKSIQEKFDEYEEFIGNHIEDLDYLKRSTAELQRPLLIMNDDIYKVMLKLYK